MMICFSEKCITHNQSRQNKAYNGDNDDAVAVEVNAKVHDAKECFPQDQPQAEVAYNDTNNDAVALEVSAELYRVGLAAVATSGGQQGTRTGVGDSTGAGAAAC